MAPVRVLVCGSRDFSDRGPINCVLSGIAAEGNLEVVIDGGATGADSMAHAWAVESQVASERYFADWDKWGKRGGPIRNQQMLDEGEPDLVVAFVNKPLNESRGTNDMVTRARARGVPVWVVRA